MPFELIVQHPFTERLSGNRVRIRSAGEHIFDPAEIEAVKDGGNSRFVVQVWMEQPTEAPKAEPEAKPATAAADPAPEHPTAVAPAAH